jgi:hypothetical protein
MAKTPSTIVIPEIKLEEHRYYLVGNASLIVHAFPEKQRKAMLGKQMKIAAGGRDARDPYAEVEAAKYILPDGRHGFPAIGFKAAAVTACTSLADVTKVAARQAFRVKGIPMHASGIIDGAFVRTALVPLICHEPVIREDVAILSGIGRKAEVRYRPEYFPWGVELEVVLNPQVISAGQLGTMFQAAGHGVGIGDYRPERDGDCGTFDLVSAAEFAAWREEMGLSEVVAKTRKRAA